MLSARDQAAQPSEQRDICKVQTCASIGELDGLQDAWRARGKVLTGDIVTAISRTRAVLAPKRRKERR